MHAIDKDLKLLMEKIFLERGFDFRLYAKELLKRRLARRMTETGAASYKDYARVLDAKPEEYKNLFNDLTVNVSHFFRNPLIFEFIYKVILPKMILYKQDSMENEIRIWSAGCAHGEEPYSIAILLLESLGKHLKNYNITIYATDIDTEVLEHAKAGVFPEENIQEVKKGLLDKYFQYDGNYRIKEEVKELVDFSYHDLTSEKFIAPKKSVFTNFDFILCRNVLIYFNRTLQRKVLSNLIINLNKNGYILLGEMEFLPDIMQGNLICLGDIYNIYQKV